MKTPYFLMHGHDPVLPVDIQFRMHIGDSDILLLSLISMSRMVSKNFSGAREGLKSELVLPVLGYSQL